MRGLKWEWAGGGRRSGCSGTLAVDKSGLGVAGEGEKQKGQRISTWGDGIRHAGKGKVVER